MDATKTLLALGWGRGAHAPGAAQTPPVSTPVQQEHQRAPAAGRQADAAPWDEIVAAENARLGLHSGPNVRGPQHVAAAANAKIPGKEAR